MSIIESESPDSPPPITVEQRNAMVTEVVQVLKRHGFTGGHLLMYEAPGHNWSIATSLPPDEMRELGARALLATLDREPNLRLITVPKT